MGAEGVTKVICFPLHLTHWKTNAFFTDWQGLKHHSVAGLFLILDLEMDLPLQGEDEHMHGNSQVDQETGSTYNSFS